MSESEDRLQRARARERVSLREAEVTLERAQARERVRVAQEREKLDRERRSAASRARAAYRSSASSTAVIPARPPEGNAVPAPITATATVQPGISVQTVVELFNHPLGDGEMQHALAALAADPEWSRVTDDGPDDELTFILTHQPSGATVHVAQQRSLVGLWNSRI